MNKDGKCVEIKNKVKSHYLIEKNNSSHNNELNVINEENTNNIVSDQINESTTNMKITSLKDINNDTLKTLEASAVHDFIQEELKKASEIICSKV